MSLWRFEFMVEGKHLERVMESISGVALNMKPPQPVGNAVVKKGKVKAESSASSYKDLVLKDFRDLAPNSVFDAIAVKASIAKHGGSESAYNHYIRAILEEKIATRRSRGTFVTTK
jgi:hypothetical protein